MPAARKAAKSKQVVVVLPTMEAKKHSVRFTTEEENVPVSNVYLSKSYWEKMGSPEKVKVTVEPA